MTVADRWLLPDGIEELLPAQALQVEALRRKLLDLYSSWGYQLVLPPLLEFTESLLVGLGSDVNLQTFKVTDQITGRTMGIRADITPQVARIDAHSLGQDGPVRLCYAGSVLHTRPKSLMASRSPIQIGAELYGDASLDSDVEIINLMLKTLETAGINSLTLDLGHVGIYQALIETAELDEAGESLLFDALQRKSEADIESVIRQVISDPELAAMLLALSQMNGDCSVLSLAREIFSAAPTAVLSAIDELSSVADKVTARMPEIRIYFDLSELRGFHYHTGLVFAALAPGYGQAIANGGRYDHVGEVFGRARPATGFNTDLKALLKFLSATAPAKGILAAEDGDETQWQKIQQLRTEGECVIMALSGQSSSQSCDRQLVHEQNQWVVKPI